MDKKALKKLEKRMPHGYSTLAVAMLKAKGKNYTRQYVGQQLKSGSNELVIEVLCEIAEKHEAKQQALAARARGEKIAA